MKHQRDLGIIENEGNGLGWESVVHRYRHQTCLQRTEVGDQKLGPVGGDDGDALTTSAATREQSARARPGSLVELTVAERARPSPVAAIHERQPVPTVLRVKKRAQIVAVGHR